MKGQRMTGIRIGAVSYLNTRPLVYGLRDTSEYSLTFDLPSALAERLRLDEIDVGLIPIVEYLRGIGQALLPGICIASDGPVRTVKLFSRVHPEKLKNIAVDAGSRTSVALLRILLSERFGVTPDFHIFRADLPEMLRRHDAALLIGDAAFTEDGAPFIWDLGEGWSDLTGLPFVYAAWALRDAQHEAQVRPWLEAATAQGLNHLQEIAEDAAGLGGQDAVSLHRYLAETLHYTLGARELKGIDRFQKYCRHYNLVPSVRDLQLGKQTTAVGDETSDSAVSQSGLAEIIDISRAR
jgi:chorismate dehydratase